jgi:hypothetical protein
MKLVYLLAGIPIAAVLIGPFFLNRVHPFVLGMPFLLSWFALALVATSIVMACIFYVDGGSTPSAEHAREGTKS